MLITQYVKENIMSELSTRLTQELLTTSYASLFTGRSTERWAAQNEMRIKARELSDNGLVDHQAIRELAMYNAGRNHLNAMAADRVFDIAQKPSGGSLRAMHSPSRRVWQGSGSCLSSVGPDIVHYISRPGTVEDIYGDAFPYVVDKLGWMAIAHDLKGYHTMSNRGGYQYVTNRLNALGRSGKPHIGATATPKAIVYGANPEAPDTIISSASGTLVTDWVDATYDRIPEFADRAVVDEAAGLFDGHVENRRAGLYDVMFAEMVGSLLLGGHEQDQMLKVFDPQYQVGVDIN